MAVVERIEVDGFCQWRYLISESTDAVYCDGDLVETEPASWASSSFNEGMLVAAIWWQD